jgi:mono/diheme cytochrome c family protein
MEIPVSLRDRSQVDAVFIAFEHGNVMEQFSTKYPVAKRLDLKCPKVVYRKRESSYSHWLYPTELQSVALVSWKLYEARLLQPTRKAADPSGWPLFLKHCQACHGIGGKGAKRGPDFLGHMEAYRRVPPLAVTDLSQHPSLHEKVKGFAEGAMPTLSHIPNKEIATLWRWLHAIHKGATK